MNRRVAPTIGAVCAIVLGLGLLAGCAGGQRQVGAASPSATPATAAVGGIVASSPPVSGRPQPGRTPPSLAPRAPSAGPELTLTGVVQAGVEGGCLVLAQGGVTYQLIGGDRDVVHDGARVTVTGHEVSGIVTICMQGRPFQVTSAHPA